MQVAQHLMGCSQSLQAVTEHVISIYSENGQDENLTETAVRNMIIDLATRKSFAAKDGMSLIITAVKSAHYLFHSDCSGAAPCKLYIASAEKQESLKSKGEMDCIVCNATYRDSR